MVPRTNLIEPKFFRHKRKSARLRKNDALQLNGNPWLHGLLLGVIKNAPIVHWQVLPLSSILDDTSIDSLAKLHPENITSFEQITIMLDQTKDWEQAWSKKIFDVIQQFDKDLTSFRQTAATQKKTQQKRAKIAKDQISFEESTKETEERIR